MPANPNMQLRRSHKKSRKGCKECKQRHTKCDETRPSCVNCTATNRRCSYLDLEPHHHWLRSDPAHSPGQASTVSSNATTLCGTVKPTWFVADSDVAAVDSHVPAVPSPDPLEPGLFNLSHMVLLHHLENEVLRLHPGLFMVDPINARQCYESIFSAAISAPYLLDELLALSATHLGTLQHGIHKDQYFRQASELQTRALTRFNTEAPQVNEENCLAMFIFSSALGLHTLVDTVATHRDFTDLLDKFTHYLRIHHGVHVITQQSWHILRQTDLRHIVRHIEEQGDLAQQRLQGTENECDPLASLLERSSSRLGLGPHKACCEAVEILRWVFSTHRSLPTPYPTHIVLSWPIRISSEFIELLEERQPVSLVILAYWAMLLWEERNFWVFGDAGRILIEHLSRHLGSHWDEWMVHPRAVLDNP
ncbi:hypothetical protein BU24DRAFT_180581 [Aaosphaeria arxii CBS 175.79]|uniref:Zn(2)-C6 fungal-type domain-containing protein n=1 Tax=Aaosphaeria arxii CBS 175.79 TaxID=1450172 RepID=A0A6A5XRV3_9PLEO|nr:uncharacterized protein BU24DRAFT_180581 [Aaosphaeria arxii CBS 175.79]KAF2015567.1 hypothetical protein BU24DRAFT_180581 [Aaosphaeria arxii CBS 175.79]